MKILSIDTSCDETSAAVTDNTTIVSNVVWSQASLHAKFGGVMPSLAQRQHSEHINWVVDRAIKKSGFTFEQMDAIAVTNGPGLSIALGVGVSKAKEIASKYNKPLIPINHIEAHILSPLATSVSKRNKFLIRFPCYGLCVSGGNTIFVLIKGIGKYEIIAQTVDDALGEALDKGARMLGLGYPGGALLEKMAKLGNSQMFILPIPLVGQEQRQIFSYSGLKTSFHRLIEKNKSINSSFPSKSDIYNLSASFQNTAFTHLERVLKYTLTKHIYKNSYFLLGGGVAANVNLRKRLRSLGKNFGYTLHIPYSNKVCGDNAGMIGVAAYLKNKNLRLNTLRVKYKNITSVDRNPRLKLTD